MALSIRSSPALFLALAALGAALPFLWPADDAAANDATAPARATGGRGSAPDGGRGHASVADAGTAPAASERLLECERSFARPILEILGRRLPERTSPEGGAREHSEAFANAAEAAGGGVAELLVATVPDPVLSGMYYTTDRLVEALEVGVETNDVNRVGVQWLRDRFWSPWATRDPNAPPEGDVLACQKHAPGVVVFRNERYVPAPDGGAGTSPRLLVLFLVGETPTWGIDETALGEALDFVHTAVPGVNEVRVVGPTYSGSAVSLRSAIAGWEKRIRDRDKTPPCFSVVSGSATNEHIKDVLDTCQDAGSGPHCPVPAPGCITYHATTLSDAVRFERFYEFLEQRFHVTAGPDHALTDVALLKESGTSYAQALDADAGAGSAGSSAGAHPQFVVTFPPHISNVLRAYEAQDKHDASNDKLSAMATSLLGTLDPSLGEPDEPHDEFPALSKRTVYSNDLLITHAIDDLAKHDVRFIGIVASDRNDVIFLAHKIRQQSTDARLFVLSSEILYSHPRYAADTQGMLVVSPYPLLETHDTPNGMLRRFSNEQEEGVFNAVETLLDRPDQRSDYVCGAASAGPAVSGGACAAPRLWVTTVGKGAIFPVRRIDDTRDTRDYAVDGTRRDAGAEAGDAVRPPTQRSWRFAVLGAVGLLTYLALLSTGRTIRIFVHDPWSRGRREPHRTLARFCLELLPGARALWTNHHAENEQRRNAAAFVGVGAVTGAALLIVAINQASSWASTRIEAPAVIAAVVAFSTLAICASFVATRAETKKRTTALCAVFLVAAAWASLEVFLRGHSLMSWSAERLVALGGGVSPVTPLLFAVGSVGLWATCTLNRLAILASTTTHQPVPISYLLALSDAEPPGATCESRRGQSPEDIRKLEERMVDSAGLLCHLGELLVSLPIVSTLIFVLFQLETLEAHPVENAAMGAVVAVPSLVVVFAVAGLAQFVRRFRELSRRLVRHPLVRSFGRLPIGLARSLERQISGALPSLDDLGVPLIELSTLVVSRRHPRGSALEHPAEASLRKATDALGDERCMSVGALPIDPVASDTMKHLMTAARTILPSLVDAWKRRGDFVHASEGARGLDRAVFQETSTLEIVHSPPLDASLVEVRLEEDYVSGIITIFLYQYVRQFRPLMLQAIGGSILLLLVIASYCFEPRHLLMMYLWLVFVIAVGAVAFAFMELDRDELLSRIARSDPGRLTIDRAFALRVVTWGALPLLSLLAVQFPGLLQGLFGWFTPMLQSFR